MKALSLFSFKKVYPLAILFACCFFGAIYFMVKPNEDDMSLWISTGASVVIGLLAVFFYTAHNRAIAVSYMEEFLDGDEYSLGEIFGEVGSYVVHIFLLALSFLLMHNIVIPFIGAEAGGLFQLSIFGFEFNALTLLINYFCIVWLFLGTAEIVTMDATFFETLGLTFQFIFDNFMKLFGFVVLLFVAHLIFQVVLVTTYQIDPMSTVPIKIIFLAYLVAMCNSFAVGFFAENADDEEEEDY